MLSRFAGKFISLPRVTSITAPSSTKFSSQILPKRGNPTFYPIQNNNSLLFSQLNSTVLLLRNFGTQKPDGRKDVSSSNSEAELIQLLQKAEDYFSNGEYEKQIAVLDKALKKSPDDPNLHAGKGLAFFELYEYDEALSCFDKASKLDPKNPHYLYYKGLILLKGDAEEEINDALEIFDKVLRIDPNHEGALEAKGEAYISLNQLTKAMETFEALLTKNPTSEGAILGKAGVLIHQGKLVEGLTIYQNKIKENPTDKEEYLIDLMQTLAQAEKYAESLKILEELGPQYEDYWSAKSSLLAGAGKSKEALDANETAIKTYPDELEYKQERVMLLFDSGKKEEAVKYLKQLRKEYPNEETLAELQEFLQSVDK